MSDITAPERRGKTLKAIMLILVVGLIVFGLLNCVFGKVLLGLIPTALGGLWWSYGLIKHSPGQEATATEPRVPKQCGLVKRWDTFPFASDGGIVVRGDVILWPGWPFYLDTEKVDIENQEMVFGCLGKSFDKTIFPLEVSVTGHPDLTSLPSFIQAGNDWKSIEKSMQDLVLNDAINRCSTHTLDGIRAGEISVEFQQSVDNLFEGKKLGWKNTLVQLTADYPDELKTATNKAAAMGPERDSEAQGNETIKIEARKLQLQDARPFAIGIMDMNPNDQDAAMGPLIDKKKVRTFKQAMEDARTLLMTRENMIVRVESSGSGAIQLNETKITMGGKK